jgi:glycosyltransferase involved in cell wall biosynthesis
MNYVSASEDGRDKVKIASIRPGVAENETAFEAMAKIYKWLEDRRDCTFRIVTSESDSFTDPELSVSSIPKKAWAPTVPNIPIFLRRFQYRNHLDPTIEWADVVLTLDPTIFYQGALVIDRSHRKGTPVLFDASKTIADTDPHWHLIRPRLERAVADTTRIIATVPKVLERYREIGLFEAIDLSGFRIMGHPVDTAQFSPPVERDDNSPTQVISVTRMVPEKGVYYTLEALDPLIRRGEITLSFLGQGPMEASIRAEAERREIADGVRLLGTVPHDEVPDVLRAADVFVNHAVSTDSWEEYFGAANLEAMACGLPCVLTDCGGISYVIREEGVATFVPQRDVSALRKAVETLATDVDERRKLGTAARDYVERTYAIDIIGDRFMRMLTETVR